MSQKARLFNDKLALEMILKEENPKKQKALGKRIKGFNQQTWHDHAKALCSPGIEAKILQNPSIKDLLVSKGNRKIGEANPHDNFFGIGLHLNEPGVHDAKSWKGKNIMGFILEDIRTKLNETS